MRFRAFVAAASLMLAEVAGAQIQNAIERHDHLLRPHSEQSCADFISRVAWDERAAWALIAKPSGARCSGPGTSIDCDKLVRRSDGRVFDLVVACGGDAPAAAVGDTGTSLGRERWVDAVPYEGGTPDPPKPDKLEPMIRDLAAQVRNLAAQIAALEKQNASLAETVEKTKSAIEAAAHDAKVGAEATLVVKDWLLSGLQANLSTRFFGAVTGTIKAPRQGEP